MCSIKSVLRKICIIIQPPIQIKLRKNQTNIETAKQQPRRWLFIQMQPLKFFPGDSFCSSNRLIFFQHAISVRRTYANFPEVFPGIVLRSMLFFRIFLYVEQMVFFKHDCSTCNFQEGDVYFSLEHILY